MENTNENENGNKNRKNMTQHCLFVSGRAKKYAGFSTRQR
jgi:hypothetical protein